MIVKKIFISIACVWPLILPVNHLDVPSKDSKDYHEIENSEMAGNSPSWIHFFDTSASATATLAYAQQASDQLPAACEAGVDNLEEEYELQVPNLDDELNTYFTCIGNIANIELYTPDSDLLIAAGTIDTSDPSEEVVDLSNYIDGNSLEISEEEKELIGVPEIEADFRAVDDETASTISSYNGSIVPITRRNTYSMRAYHRIYWGQRSTRGRPGWTRSSRIFLRSTVGQYVQSQLHVTNTPVGRYQIAFEGTARVRKHLRGMPDATHAIRRFTQRTLSSGSWSSMARLGNARGPGKYYHTLTNMKITDKSKNRKFNISNSFTLPRFQCYQTVVCKFPRGREAPY